MRKAFANTYRREFGFVLEDRKIMVDDVRIRATGRVSHALAAPTPSCLRVCFVCVRVSALSVCGRDMVQARACLC